jgi:hypothetical protein
MKRAEFTELGVKLVIILGLLNLFTSIPTAFLSIRNNIRDQSDIILLSILYAIIIVLIGLLWKSAKWLSVFIWKKESAEQIVINIDPKIMTNILLSILGIYIVLNSFPNLLGSISLTIRYSTYPIGDLRDLYYQQLAILFGRIFEFAIGIIILFNIRKVADLIFRKWENPFDDEDNNIDEEELKKTE